METFWISSGAEKAASGWRSCVTALEADAGAAYIQSMAQALVSDGWAVLAWNYRGCSGEMNRLPRFYHSGASEDLSAVIAHALAVHPGAED